MSQTCGLPALGRGTQGCRKDVRGVSGNDTSFHRSEPQFSSPAKWGKWEHPLHKAVCCQGKHGSLGSAPKTDSGTSLNSGQPQ